MCQNQNCNCKKPYYITTAIAYTSGKPHIGNTYEAVLADSIARFKRADVALPGGCNFGSRPINLHLKGFRALGAEVEEDFENVDKSNFVVAIDTANGATLSLIHI